MNAPPRTARGDEAQLYGRLHSRLERAVRARVDGPAATVEDACAHAWAQLLSHQPDRDERLLGWLVTVATREGWRLTAIERRSPPTDPSAIDQIVSGGKLEHRTRALEALEALAGLRPAEKRLLALRAAGYSYREICAIERRTYTWVNRRLARAARQLREGGEN